MRAAMHMELCLDEIRAEWAGSSAVLSEVERVRLRELIDEAVQLVSGAVRRQIVVPPSEVDLHWIKIAIRAAQGDCDTLPGQHVTTLAPAETDFAVGPNGQPASKLSEADESAAPLRLVHSSPVARPKRGARSSTLRLVSRIAAAIAIVVSLGALLTHGAHWSSRAGHLASQLRATGQPAVRQNGAVWRFAVVATPD